MENPAEIRNMAAYRRLKTEIKQTYSPGWFVGIADDQVVGAAEEFPELTANLRSRGFDPREVMIVEAGVEYPENVSIYI